ncbi:hypothetical protein BDZ94DRAFT_866584 [Collybia nuda]|uniref:DUF6534 domain-containing protein n=1 Tax=Collybia nuda TaxID=64659 RepID=A0A9P5Y470_9AGAR|nr:hypothetical protein BDZ94DRAFT_866584 [Collybia nuda]
MTEFRINIGALLIGTYINLMLYTLELVQFYHYFRTSGRAKEDRVTIKFAVIFTMVLDTLSSLASCATVYLYTIVFWGNLPALGREYWPMFVVIALTGTGTFVVQLFMLQRYWRMTAHHIVVVLISLFMIASLVGTYLTAVVTFSHYSIPTRKKGIPFVILGLGGAAICDVCITVLLVWKLYRIETENQATKSLLRRIAALAIKTGLASSVVGSAAAIAFIVAPQSQVSDAILVVLGRVYTCTMLFTLNNRGKIRGDTWIQTSDPPHDLDRSSHRTSDQHKMTEITFAPLCVPQDPDRQPPGLPKSRAHIDTETSISIVEPCEAGSST